MQNSDETAGESAAKTIRRSSRIANNVKLKNGLNELQTVTKIREYFPSTKKSRKRCAVAMTQTESSVKQAKKEVQRRKQKLIKHEHNVRKSITIPKTVPIHLDLTVSCEQLILSNGTLRTYFNSFTAQENFTNPSDSKSDGRLKCRTTRCRDRQPSVQIHSVQPMILRRSVPLAKDISDVQRAFKALHLSTVPETLPCRDKESREILETIKTKILDNSGGCMYVCGVPGTGKSSTVAGVIRSLQRQSDVNALPPFELIQMNCMQLTEPRQAYVHIHRHLSGTSLRWDDAVSRLDQFFTSSRKQRKMTILVADEFDMLKSPGQRVIYNLLNWSMTEQARLFVVAVGNIVDPTGFGGIASRLGATRFTFLPYTRSQLENIVRARLTGIDIYDDDAVKFVARKVASISGDCRRALDIFRRATEICAKDCIGNPLVITMSHVGQASAEMIINPKVVAIKGCSRYEKLFLQAVGAEISRTGVDETILLKVYQQFETICLSNGVSIVPEPGIALRISSRLGSSRILICEASNKSIHQQIMLNITFDELQYAFN